MFVKLTNARQDKPVLPRREISTKYQRVDREVAKPNCQLPGKVYCAINIPFLVVFLYICFCYYFLKE